MCKITVGLSLHRPEMIPWIAERMRQHEAIFLEEPGSPDLQPMLSGELAIEDYLLPLDVEYPDFSRAMCLLERELHAEGKAIHQVEPFVETLIHIQEFFAEGGRPDEIAPESLANYVYRAIIAATNQDLSQQVVAGRFRKDLFYRLNVFPITLPPLRERLEDIPSLVWAFVRQYEKKMGKRVDHIPRKSMDKLQQYAWPGNVRELRNVIERALIECTGRTLDVHLPQASFTEAPGRSNIRLRVN